MRAGTLATIVGVIAGGWSALGGFVFSSQAYAPQCNGDMCTSTPWLVPTGAASLGVVLVICSIAGLVAPRLVFYAEALVSLVIATLVILAYRAMDPVFLSSTLVLVLLAAVSSLVAARSRARLSEQVNPMNLPVFG